MWRADESGLMALPWSEPRTKRGQMWKYSASKSERLKGQIRNHRSGKYRPATFVQIRNHHQTDRDICHFTKFPTTLGYFGKFYSMTKRLVRMSKYVSIYFFSNMTHQCCLMQMSDWSLIWESILTSSTFENSDTLDVWTTHAMHVWYKLTNTVGNIFVYICTPPMLTVTSGPSNMCLMYLLLTGRKSFKELGCGTFDLSPDFYVRFYVCFSIWPVKDLK